MFRPATMNIMKTSKMGTLMEVIRYSALRVVPGP